MSEGKIIEIYNKGISEVINVIKHLSNQIKEQSDQINKQNKQIEKLTSRVNSLENQTSKNSNNSSKPSSTDGFKKKIKSLRVKSNKKPGGQVGHKGVSLELSDNPDEVIVHSVNICDKCGTNLEDVKPQQYIVRQVVDISDINKKIIEHKVEVKRCPKCRRKNTAKFPEEIDNVTQYGENIKAISVYLSQYQLLSFKRTKELFKDLYGIKISTGTLVNFNKKCYEKLKEIEKNIKGIITNSSDTIHFDETGVNINKKLNWLHVASNNNYTYYEIHNKRGCEAMLCLVMIVLIFYLTLMV